MEDKKLSFDVDDVPEKVAKLPFKIRLAWSLPQFSVLSVYMLLTIHATIFYDYLGANLAFLAFFTAFSRSFDVITDPVMAWVSDSSTSRWGRRYPFILGAMPIYAISLVLVLGAGVILPEDEVQTSGGECNATLDFAPPVKQDNNIVSYWYGITFVIFYIADTACQVPYNALGPELAPDPDNRSRMYFLASIIGFFGTLFGAVAPVILEAKFAKEQAFFLVACLFGGYYMLAVSNLACTAPEKPPDRSSEGSAPPVPGLVPSVNRAFKNPAFSILIKAWLIDAIGWFAIAALLPFFLKYIVRPGITPGFDQYTDEMWLGLAFFCFFAAAIVGAPMWKCVENRVGLFKAFLIFNVAMGISNALFLFVGRGQVIEGLVVSMLNGIPLGGKYLAQCHLAMCITVDEFYTGEKSEAKFTMFSSFVPKVVSIPSNALPLAIISAAGFIGSKKICDGELGQFVVESQEQTELVQILIKVFFIILPVTCNAISFYIKTKFPIKTEEDREALALGIHLHQQGKPATCPISGLLVPSHKSMTASEAKLGVLLDHFSIDEQMLLLENGGDFKVLWHRAMIRFVACFIGLGVSVTLVITTFHLLLEQSLSWVPSFSQVCVGIFLMCGFFYFVKMRTAKYLMKHPISCDFIRQWSEVSHTSVAQQRRLEDNIGSQVATVEPSSEDEDE